MKEYTVTIKLMVEAHDYAEVVALVQNAITERNKALIMERKIARISIASIACVEEKSR